MRILIAARAFGLAQEIEQQYDGVSVHSVVTSYSEAREAIRTTDERDHIDVVLLHADLASAHDRKSGTTLADVIRWVIDHDPTIRILVVSRSAHLAKEIANLGVEPFVETEGGEASAKLADLLNLVKRSDVAPVIAFVSGQGGSGKTYLATAIATALANGMRRNDTKALLWELDLQWGGMAHDPAHPELIGEDGRRTIVKLLNRPPIRGDNAREVLASALITSSMSSLPYDVLLAPHSTQDVVSLYRTYDDLHALNERMEAIMDVARRSYAGIILDVGPDMIHTPSAELAFNNATRIVVPILPDAKGLRVLGDMKWILGSLHIAERSVVVVNRADVGSKDILREINDLASRTPSALDVVALRQNPTPEDWSKLASSLLSSKR